MNNLQTHHLRTKPEIERNVVKLIALGNRYADVSNKTGIPISTIKKIKKRNNVVLVQMKRAINRSDTDIITRIHLKGLRELEKRLDDPSELTAKDLINIVKEMQNRANSIANQPTINNYELEQQNTINQAFDSGDEVAMINALSIKNNNNL